MISETQYEVDNYIDKITERSPEWLFRHRFIGRSIFRTRLQAEDYMFDRAVKRAEEAAKNLVAERRRLRRVKLLLTGRSNATDT